MKTTFLKLILFLLFGFVWQSAFAQVDLSIVWQKQSGERINSARFSADGNFIYYAIENAIIKLDAKTGETVSQMKDSIYNVFSDLEISKDGNTIMTIFPSKGVHIWDTKSEKIIKYIKYEKTIMDGVMAADLSPSGDYYIAYVTEYIEVNNIKKSWLIKYDIKSNSEVKRIVIDQGTTRKVVISNDGRRFVIGSYYKNEFTQKFYNRLILWDTETLTPLDTLQNLEVTTGNYGYRLIKFSPDDKYLGCIRETYDGPDIFDLNTKEMVRTSDGRACITIEFLNSLYYLSTIDVVEALELHNLIKSEKLKSYGFYPEVIQSFKKSENEYLVFTTSDTLRMFSTNITNIENSSVLQDALIIKYVDNKILIEYPFKTLINSNLIICDLNGRVILTEKISNYLNNQITKEIHLSPGIYFCKVQDNNKEYIKKFEIVR